MDNRFVELVAELRKRLSREGILMPVVRIRDEVRLETKEFMVLAYQNVLYSEQLECVGEKTLEYIIQKLGETVRSKYAEILNADIIKNMLDNLRLKYPALVEEIVPEQISYGLLTDVVKGLLKRGNSILYLPKVVEILGSILREEGKKPVAELIVQVARALEREDNLWMVLRKRRERS